MGGGGQEFATPGYGERLDWEVLLLFVLAEDFYYLVRVDAYASDEAIFAA